MNRRVTAIVALSTLAVAGCGSATSTGSAATSAPSGASSAASTPSADSSSRSAPSSSPAATSGGAVTEACSLIDESTAASILGGPITKKVPAQIGDLGSEDGPATKLDGCLYRSAAGSIGYDVVKFGKLSSAQLAALAKAKASAQLNSGMAKEFTSAVGGALAYTLTLPTGTDSIVNGAKGDWYVTVSVALKSHDAKASQRAVDAAAQALFGAL